MNNISFNSTTPTFKAKPLLKTNVLKKALNSAEEYLPKEANIIEMSYENPEDSKVLETIKNDWVGAEFTPMICSSYTTPERKIYAITSQKENFEKPDADKILGVADFAIKGDKALLRFLQADSRIIKEKNREIKGVGKAIMQGIIKHLKTLNCNSMDLYASRDVQPFYKKIFPSIKNKPTTMESSTNLILDI